MDTETARRRRHLQRRAPLPAAVLLGWLGCGLVALAQGLPEMQKPQPELHAPTTVHAGDELEPALAPRPLSPGRAAPLPIPSPPWGKPLLRATDDPWEGIDLTAKPA